MLWNRPSPPFEKINHKGLYGAQGAAPTWAEQGVCNLLQLRRWPRNSRRPADPQSARKYLDLNAGQPELPGPSDGPNWNGKCSKCRDSGRNIP